MTSLLLAPTPRPEPLLVELVESARTGNPGAQEALLSRLDPLVSSLVFRYTRPGVDPEVLRAYAQEEAILAAAGSYDPARSAVPTYMRAAIRHALQLAVAEFELVALPDHSQRQARYLRRTEARLTQALHRKPDVAELSNATGIRGPRIRALRERPKTGTSLSWLQPSEQEAYEKHHEDTFHAFSNSQRSPEERWLAAFADALSGTQASLLREAICRLTLRKREIVEARFGLNGRPEETLAVLGQRLGCSGEAVRKEERNALVSLRADLSARPEFEELARERDKGKR